MELKFMKGFLVYTDKDNPVFVVPHSGPALESPIDRDDNAETVASLCFKKIGGTLIISSMPRKRLWGIDFNRDIPPKEIAIKNFKNFESKKGYELYDYNKKYAWVAKDEKDYEERLRIYQQFWGEVSKGKYIIFIHRTFPKMKIVPSVMDIITFKGESIKNNKIQKIIREINTKYFGFFEKIEKDYKQAIISETKRNILHLLSKYKSFNINEFGEESRENIKKDIEKIMKYADKEVIDALQKNFTPQNYLIGVENALKDIPMPKITIESLHDGSLAFAVRRKLFPLHDKVVIEVEPSRFMNFWHPQITSDIIIDVIKKLEE